MTREERRNYVRNHLISGDLMALLATRASLISQCIDNPNFEARLLTENLDDLHHCLMLLHTEFDLTFEHKL